MRATQYVLEMANRHIESAECEHFDLSCTNCAPRRVIPFSRRQAEADPNLVKGDPELIQAISDHVQRHVGPIASVLHEERSRFVHVDIHMVRPTEARPYYTLVTSGMSERPMSTPPGHDFYAHAELVMKLPRSWPMSHEAWRDERHFWPIRWLRDLARYPHECGTWLGWGHTIPNGPEAAPFAPGTKLGCMVLEHVFDEPDLAELELPDDRVVHFYALLPIRRDEMRYKLRHGASRLSHLLQAMDVSHVIDPKRRSALAEFRRRGTRSRAKES